MHKALGEMDHLICCHPRYAYKKESAEKKRASRPRRRYLTVCRARFALNSRYAFGNRVRTPKRSISPTSNCVMILVIPLYPLEGTTSAYGLGPAVFFADLHKQGMIFVEERHVLFQH